MIYQNVESTIDRKNTYKTPSVFSQSCEKEMKEQELWEDWNTLKEIPDVFPDVELYYTAWCYVLEHFAFLDEERETSYHLYEDFSGLYIESRKRGSYD